ncbi:MAG: winged helix-turn-helix domain-containing protein [Thermoguttaceae bacterium]|nr:winged helix-turn-helix domain-containing protein [Thermoguttaceae bacterium]
MPAWVGWVVGWLVERTPRDFGLVRWRWTCAGLTLERGITVSAETVRRYLHRAGFVWRRPRPVLARSHPAKEEKLAHLRGLVASLPPDETVVFEDEVELHLCPKIGACWMRRGQ